MFSEYNDILTIEEVSRLMRVKPYRVYELIKTGKLRRMNTGKPYLIPKAEVIRFVNESVIE